MVQVNFDTLNNALFDFKEMRWILFLYCHIELAAALIPCESN